MFTPRSARGMRWTGLACVALFPALATAEPTQVRWTGVDLTLVEGLSVARADGFSSGFTADFKGGLVRVYVLPSDSAASWWVARMATVAEKQKPTEVPLALPDPDAPPPEPLPPDTPPPPPKRLDTAQELLASGDKLVIARVDNVAIMVEVARGARDKAEAVLATLTDLQEPWPEVPPLERTGAGWALPPTDGLAVRYQGGTLGPGPGLRFQQPPSMVIVYDSLGRAARQAYDPMGLPIDSKPPWDGHTPVERVLPTPEPQ